MEAQNIINEAEGLNFEEKTPVYLGKIAQGKLERISLRGDLNEDRNMPQVQKRKVTNKALTKRTSLATIRENLP
jgi:hypothetical protein